MNNNSMNFGPAPVVIPEPDYNEIFKSVLQRDGMSSQLDADRIDGLDSSSFIKVSDTSAYVKPSGTPKLIFVGVQPVMPIGTVVPVGLSFLSIASEYNPNNMDISNNFLLLPHPNNKTYFVEWIPGARTGWPGAFNPLLWVKTTNGHHSEPFSDDRPIREPFKYGIPDLNTFNNPGELYRPIVGFRVNNVTGAEIVLDGSNNSKKYRNSALHNSGNQPRVCVWEVPN